MKINQCNSLYYYNKRQKPHEYQNVEKAFDKSQHNFRIKILNELGEGNFLKLIKYIYEKTSA